MLHKYLEQTLLYVMCCIHFVVICLRYINHNYGIKSLFSSTKIRDKLINYYVKIVGSGNDQCYEFHSILFLTIYEYYYKQYIFIIFLQDTEYGRKRGSCSVVNFRTFESFRF